MILKIKVQKHLSQVKFGSSRAKKLLCFAIKEDNIEDYKKNKKKLEEYFEILEI